MSKKRITLALLLTASMCLAQPVSAEELDRVNAGLNCRSEVFGAEATGDLDGKALAEAYKSCAQAEWDYWKDTEKDQLTEQQKYYVSAVEKQAAAFTDFSDSEACVSAWKAAQKERYRALYYMHLEGSIVLDEILLAECKEVLKADDSEEVNEEKKELVKQFQRALGFSEEDADGDFGSGSRETLKAYVAETGINMAFISNLDSFNHKYITGDLVEYIQNSVQEAE